MRTIYYFVLAAVFTIILVLTELGKADPGDSWPLKPEQTQLTEQKVRVCLDVQVNFYADICGEEIDAKNTKKSHEQGVQCAVQEIKKCLGIIDGFETLGEQQ